MFQMHSKTKQSEKVEKSNKKKEKEKKENRNKKEKKEESKSIQADLDSTLNHEINMLELRTFFRSFEPISCHWSLLETENIWFSVQSVQKENSGMKWAPNDS